ncbi:response regulator transcription factor [Candidatus Latescibacterota bacterium]
MKKILVVDDDPAVQRMVSEYLLKITPFKVFIAEDGEVALDIVKNNPPDFIILDVILPKINGLAFIRDLRKIKNAENIPVILMSGEMVDDGIRQEGLSLGVVDYILKPMDMKYLIEKINSFLSPEML